jgi:ABC-type Na+ transport system ATPase subunit NatA
MDQIDPAHAKTFEWLLSPSMLADEVPGCQLLKWLNNDGPLFSIGGKAGSGKSTLMKMLYEDGRMLENIRTWAKVNPVVTSSFFF